MKILFLSRYQYPLVKSGGTGVVVYELIKELDRIPGVMIEHWTWEVDLNKSNNEIRNMKGFSPLKVVNLDNVNLKKLFNIVLTNLNMLKEFEKLKKFDVIHIHTWELFFVGIIAKYLWGIPIVFTTHDVMQDDKPGEVHATDIYQFGVLGEKVIASEIDAVISVSNDNLSFFKNIYPEVKDKIHVIPNGVNLDDFTKKESFSVFDKHNIPDDISYIFFLGRASKQKGINILIQIIKLLPTNIPFVIATSTMSLPQYLGQPNNNPSLIN